jgi:translation elongation factor EF-G
MTDIQRMGGTFEGPEQTEDMAILTGSVPVSEMGGYWTEVAAYTQGRGRLSCTVEGYRPCHNAEDVIAACGYDPERDVEHPSGSVFCSHGAGVTVPWNEVREHMHLDSGWRSEEEQEEEAAPTAVYRQDLGYAGNAALDKELQAIFERT